MTTTKLTDAGKQALAELVSLTEADNKLPGFAIAVTNTDEQLFASAGGNKVFGNPTSGKVTPESMFWICSLTKLITSIAALQLVEQGKLSVDDPVSKYIPQFNKVVVLEGDYMSKETRPYPGRPAKEAITVARLLNHSSGLAYFTRNPEVAHSNPACSSIKHGPTREATSERFIQLLQEEYPGVPVFFEPGTAFTYGFNTDILGVVIEKVVGKSLEEYCKETIFKPVGMKTTTFRLTEESNQKLVGMTFRNADGSVSPWADHTRLMLVTLKKGFGWAGLCYLIDPATGIAIVVGSQVIPTMDAGAVALFNKVEDIVYANLG
ncbi:beta-lactamase/transpeptidase-like protein [Coprinellus micaceus]|uniref:Beta-lactamase/transpeptidase-like protein n=1 Tax=Coprinellus micaceus TaxID=71717 RepID=A0A4Y7T649_COPMI|nr:beta-lactamase/transpeptidase-like protein [Coprinellus micaceus]